MNGLFPKLRLVQLNTVSEPLLNALKAHRVFRFLQVGLVLAACRSTRVKIFRSHDRVQPVTTHRISKI